MLLATLLGNVPERLGDDGLADAYRTEDHRVRVRLDEAQAQRLQHALAQPPLAERLSPCDCGRS